MKNKKWSAKLLVSLLACAMMASVFAGCNSAADLSAADSSPAEAPASDVQQPSEADGENVPTTGEKVKIVYWSHFGGEDGSYMDNLVKNFNAASDHIEAEHLQVINENYYAKLKTGISSGEGPDIATGDADRLTELKAGEMVLDMKAYGDELGVDWSSYNQNILESCTLDGETLAIPLSSYTSILFTNKKLLEDADMLRLNDKGQVDFGGTPESFLAFLEEYNGKKPADVYTIVGSNQGDEINRFWWSFFGQTGETLLSADMTSTNVGSENSRKALTLLASLADNGWWPRGMEDPDQVFIAGKAAFYMSGVWWVGALSENPDLDVIPMPIPQVYDTPAAWGGTHVFYLTPHPSQTEEQKKAVVEFADWMASNAGEWVKASHLPAKPMVEQSEEYKALKNRDTYIEVNDYIVTMPPNQNLTAIVDVMKKYMPMVMDGSSTVDEALATCEQEINALL